MARVVVNPDPRDHPRDHPRDDTVIALDHVRKLYSLEPRPLLRLWRQLRGQHDRGPVHHALHDVNLQVRRGEVVGVIGRNGAGKSTLLQIVCGVLQPTTGQRRVHGRVAALLELGAGFNPDLSGRENVRLNGPLLGLSAQQLEARLPEIIEFAGIGDYIDQPVRSYSSGMFVRLAFSMATSVDPDILIIDEALSVGDDAFARKSFERIMKLKDRGATILFCSHSLFQVEQLCSRALWIMDGRVQYDGLPAQAVVEYNAWLARQGQSVAALTVTGQPVQATQRATAAAAIEAVSLRPADAGGAYRSGHDALDIRIRLRSDPGIACPTLGLVLYTEDGRTLTSAGTWLDHVVLPRQVDGQIDLTWRLPALPLLKGRYSISLYVMCERAIDLYAAAEHVLAFEVVQDNVQQGIVALAHEWITASASLAASVPAPAPAPAA